MARELYFVLTPGFMLLDFAGPAEAFRIANQFGAALHLHYCAPHEATPSSLGLPLGGLAPLPDTLPDGAVILIPGAAGSADAYAQPEARTVIAWLRRVFDPARHILATVCSAALLAAEAGWLAHRQCTTHHTLLARLAESAPSARVQDNRVYVQDGPVWSSAGITAGIDMALQMVSQLAGPAIARDAARHMVVYFRRSPGDPQLSPWLAHRNHLHPAVHRAQDLIAAAPDESWPVQRLAEAVHVSARHLSRLFREQAGVSVHDYQTALRLALAMQWRHAGFSKEKAALAAGFSSARQFNRAAAAPALCDSVK
ncbi:helix-turn-helix domain-containing protein [uncultured Aquitalea sp.]|uniref:GlxA family transcriptional regulator n=1 Tax=uncultured Aquitalea sp. TaxID=540272 RepID=UPI0025EC000E|nr:helix-turn-helix domain-containing protein [uncultured Aquitalea sp.]